MYDGIRLYLIDYGFAKYVDEKSLPLDQHMLQKIEAFLNSIPYQSTLLKSDPKRDSILTELQTAAIKWYQTTFPNAVTSPTFRKPNW